MFGSRFLNKSAFLFYVFLGMGFFFRLFSYMYNRSLWHDETNLVFSLAQTSWNSLQLPLSGSPGGAYLFHVIEKAMINVYGFNDYALRFFPFLCSCLALFLFFYVAKRYLPTFIGLVSLFLFACSDNIIYYAIELRPHSLDILITCIGIYFYFNLNKKILSLIDVFLLCLFGIFSIFSSFIASIILFSLGISLFFKNVLKKNKHNCFYLMYVFASWIAIFSFFYFFSYQFWTQQSNSMMYYYNVFQYLHFPGFSLLEVKENVMQICRIVAYFVGLRMESIDVMPSDIVLAMSSVKDFILFLYEYLFFFIYVFVLLLSNGFILLFSLIYSIKQKNVFNLFLLLPIFVVFILTTNFIYPFLGRHLLFLFPLLFVLVASWLNNLKNTYKTLTVILCVFLLINPIFSSFNHLFSPRSLNKLKNSFFISQSIDYDRCYVLAEYDWKPFYEKRYKIDITKVTSLDSIDDLDNLSDTYSRMLFILNLKKLAKQSQFITFINRYTELGYVIDYVDLNNKQTTMFTLNKKKG